VPAVARPALIVHAFAPIGAAPADQAVTDAYLRHMWSAAQAMGMTESLLDGLPTELPAHLPTADHPTFSVLAGMTANRSDRVAQAFCFVRHDVVGIGVALASTLEHGRLETWGSILNAWRKAGGDEVPPPQLLGATRAFIAHAAVPAEQIAAAFREEVRTVLRSVGLDVWDSAYRTADGFTLWDWQDPENRRALVALSNADDEAELSRWLWWQDRQELATFGRYLLNASKMAFEARVYGLTRATVNERVLASDARIAELHKPQPVPGYSAGLEVAQHQLADAQAESSELAIELTRLRALQRTIGIARHNLTLTTPVPAADQRASSSQMFERDQALASWLEGQIEMDLGYAQGAVERAREAQQVTQLRLQQQLAHLTRAQSRLALLQTSLVAALLGINPLISILGIRPSLSDAIKVPLLATGVALLLALPPLAAHWFERYGLIDDLAAALCGAATGWLVSTILTGDAASPVGVLTTVAGAGIGWLLTVQHDRRFRGESPLPRDGH
jgi:hypothetical protein